jgi:hypothetical protein
MSTSLLDRLGLGNARAVANAQQEALRPRREEQLVAELVAALSRHEEQRGSPATERRIDSATAA